MVDGFVGNFDGGAGFDTAHLDREDHELTPEAMGDADIVAGFKLAFHIEVVTFS